MLTRVLADDGETDVHKRELIDAVNIIIEMGQ